MARPLSRWGRKRWATSSFSRKRGLTPARSSVCKRATARALRMEEEWHCPNDRCRRCPRWGVSRVTCAAPDRKPLPGTAWTGHPRHTGTRHGAGSGPAGGCWGSGGPLPPRPAGGGGGRNANRPGDRVTTTSFGAGFGSHFAALQAPVSAASLAKYSKRSFHQGTHRKFKKNNQIFPAHKNLQIRFGCLRVSPNFLTLHAAHFPAC